MHQLRRRCVATASPPRTRAVPAEAPLFCLPSYERVALSSGSIQMCYKLNPFQTATEMGIRRVARTIPPTSATGCPLCLVLVLQASRSAYDPKARPHHGQQNRGRRGDSAPGQCAQRVDGKFSGRKVDVDQCYPQERRTQDVANTGQRVWDSG